MGAPCPANPLVDRIVEAEAAAECLRRVVSGSWAAMLFEGEAGIGKTRLMDEALVHAEELGITVLRASGQELDRTRPFGVIVDALGLVASSPDPERAGLAEVLQGGIGAAAETSLAVGSGPANHYRVVEGVLALVERLTSGGPVVLAIDDLHWADPSTLLTLHSMARRLRRLPLGVLATLRPLPRSSEFDRVVEELGQEFATHLVLGPLKPAEVDTLARSAAAGASPGPGLRAELERARGNPLFVIELVRALADEGALRVEGGVADVSAPGLPPSLRLVLLRRLSYLSPSTLEVLRVASILGSSFDVGQLATVIGRSSLDLLAALGEALRAGVLGEAGPRLAFRHDLIREALYSDLAPALRAALHVQVARALASIGAPAAQVAEHFAAGAAPGDQEALRWLREAACHAVATAPAAAAQLLERALRLAGADSAQRDLLAAELVVAMLWSGRIEEAESTALRMLARHHDPPVESTVRLGLIQALLAQGKTLDAVRQSAVAVQEPGVADDARAELKAMATFGHIYTGNLEAAAAAAQAAREEAERIGDDLAVCVALCALSHVAMWQGDVDRAVEQGARAVGRAERSATRRASLFQCDTFLGLSLLYADRFSEAEKALDHGRRLSEEIGAVWNLPMYQWAFVWLRFSEGSWDDAIAEAETGISLAEEVAARIGLVSVQSKLALIALHRNDVRGADGWLRQAEATLAATGPQPRGNWVPWARALVDEAMGDAGAALDEMHRSWELCRSLQQLVEYAVIGPDYVRLLATAGAREEAEQVTRQVEQVAARMGTPSALGGARRCRGLLEGDPGVLWQAVDALRAVPRPLDRSLACEDAAHALAARGRAPEALALLEEALEGYERLGASRDIARVDSVLRSLGLRRGRRGARGRPAAGWESLTRTELEVVRLITEGLTNREVGQRLYVSPRTVETHLSHVFAKLGVASRVELKAEAARRAAEARSRS